MTRMILRLLNTPLLIFIVILGIGVQSSLFSSSPLSFFQPDILLPTVIWCALRRGFEEGGVITLLIASLGEIHSATPQGVFLILYMVVFLCVRMASRLFVLQSLFSFGIATLFSSLGWKLINLLLLYLLGINSKPWQHTLTTIPTQVAVEALFSLWIYRNLDRFDRMTFKNQRMEQIMDEAVQLNDEGF
ncbi:MAG: hypothetical protein ACO3A2_09685 [Bdellovibrionia bacterium]